MQISFLLVIVLFFKVYQPLSCSTQIIVTDCDNKPVASATVILQTCKDKKKIILSTDSNGEALFALCRSDICRISISYVGYNSKEIINVKDCCSGGTDSVCKIKLCSD